MKKLFLALTLSVASCPVFASQSLTWLNLARQAERNNSAFVTQVKGIAAVDSGVRGKGVTVAVLDTGVQGLHPEFFGRLLTGFDATTKITIAAPFLADRDGHGTHVAGVIGAARDGRGMHGIAPEVSLLPVRVFDDDGIATSSSLGNGLRYVNDSPAFVVNLSLGAPRPLDAYFESALLGNIQAGKLVVVAAGNGGGRNPTWPARYAKEAPVNGQIIVVGAVDENNQLTSFSNSAGDTANRYIVAPGVGLMSTYNASASGYGHMSGTSMAAPVVSGAAALLKSRWPALNARQTAEILFSTATDLGEPGVDPMYGWGLLNVEKAMRPVGGLGLLTHAGTIPVSQAQAQLSPAAAGAAKRLQGISLSGFDHFGRDFKTDIPLVRMRSGELETNTLQKAVAVLGSQRIPVTNGRLFLARSGPAASGSRAGGTYLVQHFSGSPIEITFATGALTGVWHGLADSALPGMGSAAFGLSDNPYFGFVNATRHAGIGVQLAGAWKTKVGFLTRDNRGGESGGSGASIAEISRTFGSDLWISIQGSLFTEQGILGTRLKQGSQYSRGRVMTFRAAHKWSNTITSFVSYSGARNSMRQTGIFYDVNSYSDAWTLGLIGEHHWRKNDRLLLELSRPVAVTAGALTAQWVNGFNEDGSERIERHMASMVSEKREIKLSAAYLYPLAVNAYLSFGFHWRDNADNVNDASKIGGAMSWHGQF
ncbi:predicted subtilase [Aromatoleum aromaticum EbN1]|uniref:Predicted subtilase n=1 Tax=Aromatoleum aromaticum (strain DSM 19018 / LMG 30748 / EbN1) TaxID=76114 RepID=Q5P8D7_AROAE|nr:S8 family peptidase [Aromatoleum aromaticum]CAI06422.1 predicted subtilase [Aromatoleum aromaticum EbN1]